MLRRHRPLTARLLPALVAGAILLAACGSDDSSGDTTTPTLALDPANSTTTVPDKPTVSSLPAVPLTELVVTDLTEGSGPEAKAGDTRACV